jgi:HD-GYP domain-containing protein (c-di-GMP phosphodiesterase class II)
MREISLERVVPGMVTARSVYPPGESAGLPLVAAEVAVTEALKSRMRRAGIESILIDDELSAGIESVPPITDEVRRKSLTVVRDTFAQLRASDAPLSLERVNELEATMTSIMAEISSRRGLLVCLSDLSRFGGSRLDHAVSVCVVGCAVARTFFNDHGWRDYKGQRRNDQIAERLQKLGIGLLLQDVGSMALPEELWEKRTQLSAEERALVQRHPVLGVELLEGSEVSPLTKVTIAQHHERFDGSGYPRGLAHDDIHDHGHIAAVAEGYVSLCSDENGVHRFEPHEAYQLVLQARGRLFHPDVVDAFAQTIAPYGPGQSVRLSDGSSAIVVRNSAQDATRPVVRVTHDAGGQLYQPPFEVDLTEEDGLLIAGAVDGLPTDQPVATR